MTFDHQYVLCFGRDEPLRETRLKLLEYAGYAAFATSDQLIVEDCLLCGDVNILVLCHSLDEEEVDKIAEFHREISSPASLLYLGKRHRKPAVPLAHVYNAQSGPAFIAAVSKLGNLFAVPSNN